jgi:subfamily B ATP-binding cassette protein MsbA
MDNHLRRILSYTFKYWQRLLASGITATLFGIFSAAPTYGLQHVVDTVFISKKEHLLIPFIIGFVLLFLLKGIFMYASGYYMNWVGNKVVNDIRADLFKRIIYYPISFYQKKTTGQLMSYFLNDIAMIQNATSAAVRNGVRSFFEAIFLLGVAFIQNWKLAALIITLGPVIAYIINRMGSYMRTTARQTQDKMGRLSSTLQEIFIGVREIKSFNAEKIEINRFRQSLSDYFGTIMRNVRIVSLTPAFIEVLSMTGIGIVFYIASYQVLRGSITPGQLASFFASVLLAYQPLKRLIAVYADVQSGLAAASRVFEIMDMTYPAIENRSLCLQTFQHEINFDNLSFWYEKGSPVLEKVSINIQKGETIGLIGRSGAGKSTICDLLLGFIQPTSGKLFIDGHDITQLSLASLRNQIGYVGQQTFLFNDTVLANILYSNPQATNDEVVKACIAAHAHEFIIKLSSGYKTLVGENGSQLSGGQKQRLTIARALLKKPQIIIFDEATSALDSKSEDMICKALEDIRKNKTLIIISHRMSLIEKMNRIFTIQDRQLIELSKHEINQIALEQV